MSPPAARKKRAAQSGRARVNFTISPPHQQPLTAGDNQEKSFASIKHPAELQAAESISKACANDTRVLFSKTLSVPYVPPK